MYFSLPYLIQNHDVQSQKQKNFHPPNISNHPLAFILSLLGGVVIVLGGVLGSLFGFIGGPFGYGETMGGYGGFLGGIMGGYFGNGAQMMHGFYAGYGYGYYTPELFALTMAGLVSGIIVLVAALQMRKETGNDVRILGTIILVFSIISALTIGGLFLTGGALGIIGGGLALAIK